MGVGRGAASRRVRWCSERRRRVPKRRYQAAIEKLEGRPAVKYLADACQSYGDFLRRTGRESEALDYMKRALALTRSLPDRVT